MLHDFLGPSVNIPDVRALVLESANRVRWLSNLDIHARRIKARLATANGVQRTISPKVFRSGHLPSDVLALSWKDEHY